MVEQLFFYAPIISPQSCSQATEMTDNGFVMKPQRQLQGQPRKIVGFHQDENLDWVAELECGHQQHVRHNPPWTLRHWVTTTEGRQAHIGQVLQCLACANFESALLSVWEQSLVQNSRSVSVGGETFSVRTTANKKLKQVDFRFEGRDIRGLEQNPLTKSHWAAVAREGSKVMQFLERGKYVAVVVDGKVHNYPGIKSG